LYYYYTRGNPSIDREKARREEEEVKRKLKEVGEAGKGDAEEALRRGQQKYEEAKVGCG
jgi:hypothetical protein